MCQTYNLSLAQNKIIYSQKSTQDITLWHKILIYLQQKAIILNE